MLTHARQVRALAAASTESAARVAPAIVRLQMLAALREAWALRWPGLALGPATPDRGTCTAGGRSSGHQSHHANDLATFSFSDCVKERRALGIAYPFYRFHAISSLSEEIGENLATAPACLQKHSLN